MDKYAKMIKELESEIEQLMDDKEKNKENQINIFNKHVFLMMC